MIQKRRVLGIDYLEFEASEYTCGMVPVIFSPKNISVQGVADLAPEGFYLNPNQSPDSLQIFAMRGTKEQFDQFYIICAEAEAVKKSCALYGLDCQDEKKNKLRNDLMEYLFKSFKPWYEGVTT